MNNFDKEFNKLKSQNVNESTDEILDSHQKELHQAADKDEKNL